MMPVDTEGSLRRWKRAFGPSSHEHVKAQHAELRGLGAARYHNLSPWLREGVAFAVHERLDCLIFQPDRDAYYSGMVGLSPGAVRDERARMGQSGNAGGGK